MRRFASAVVVFVCALSVACGAAEYRTSGNYNALPAAAPASPPPTPPPPPGAVASDETVAYGGDNEAPNTKPVDKQVVMAESTGSEGDGAAGGGSTGSPS